jgi:lipoprotein-releasing system permease protein
MPMQDAQTLLMLGDDVGMVEVQVSDPDKVEKILSPLHELTQGRALITDWRQMNKALFEALDLERVVMFIVVSIIVLVAAFNIASALIMLVKTKTRDIAILRTMGASSRSMLKIFMSVGLAIGLTGIGIGLVLGFVTLLFRQGFVSLVHWMTGVNPWDPTVRILSDLPAKTDPVEVVAIVVVALILTFPATLFPARKAASTDPVQVLRYE